MKSFITGVGALALCVIAGGAVALSSPEAPQARQATEVESSAAPATLVCGGGFERTLEEGVDVEEVDEGVSQTSWAFADPAGATILNGKQTTGLEGSPSFMTASSELVGTLSSVAAIHNVHMAGANIHIAQAGDTRGMASNPCVSLSSDAWLVGSTTDVGTANQLVVTNPGQTAVTVNLEAFGSVGPLDLGSHASLAVDAASTQRFDLDGVIPGDSRIALHATTSSGAVGISLQQNSLDGATPAGVGFITGAAANDELTIPGVTISSEESAVAPTLRLVNPGSETATASITLTGQDGREDLPGGSDVVVAPGSVLDLSLDGVDPGEYAVRITGEEPLAAGVMLSSVDKKSGARDIAWAAPTESYTNATVMFGDVPASLGIVGESDRRIDVTVTPITADGTMGEPDKVTVAAGSYATFSVPENCVGLTLESDEPVQAAITAAPDLAIDWMPLTSFESSRSTQRIALSN